MSWEHQQSGRYGGNAPHPNDTAGSQDYWRGQNERKAADEARNACKIGFVGTELDTYTGALGNNAF